MENIRISKKDTTDDEVIQVGKEEKCHNFVSALPNGYETLIGENGSLLSGGERQRISIVVYCSRTVAHFDQSRGSTTRILLSLKTEKSLMMELMLK